MKSETGKKTLMDALLDTIPPFEGVKAEEVPEIKNDNKKIRYVLDETYLLLKPANIAETHETRICKICGKQYDEVFPVINGYKPYRYPCCKDCTNNILKIGGGLND